MNDATTILLCVAIGFLFGLCWRLVVINMKGSRDLDRTIDMYHREREERQRAHRHADAWERKYRELLQEYEELDEIEEGEEYVRKSLGYPPEDEDHEESA